VYRTTQLLPGVARVSIKNEGNREIIYGNCISASRADRITHGTLWIGGSNDKNSVYTTTQILTGVARVSIKYEGNQEINYGTCISASRTDRITHGTIWIEGSNDKNSVYTTTHILTGVARVSIKYEGNREINYGNCIPASRPDRITHGTLWIGGSNDKNGVYSNTKLLPGVDVVYIKMKELEKLIMEMVLQFHAPPALPPVLYG
jgi:hypothetical protein